MLFIAAAKAAMTWNDFIERIRKEGFTPMPGLVAQVRWHRRKRLILPSPLVKENRLSRSASDGREDRRLHHARRRRRHIRGVTESLPYVQRTNVVTSHRAVGAVEKHKSEICPKVNASILPRKE